MRCADDRGEREDRRVAADRHPHRDQRRQRRPNAKAARQQRPEQQPDRDDHHDRHDAGATRLEQLAQRQSGAEEHDPDPQGDPRRRPRREAGPPGRRRRCRPPARARAPRPFPVRAATQVPTSRAATATRTHASRPGSAAPAIQVAGAAGVRAGRAAGCPGRTCGRCRRSGPAWSGRPSPASGSARRRRRSGRPASRSPAVTPVAANTRFSPGARSSVG